jgi:hypothetical protein
MNFGGKLMQMRVDISEVSHHLLPLKENDLSNGTRGYTELKFY